MNVWIVTGLVVIGILTLLLMVIKKCREHFKTNYQSIAWTILVAFSAAFIGVLLAFRAENWRHEKIEKEFINNKLVSFLFETSQNIANINDIRSNFTEHTVSIKHLNSTIAMDLLSEPLTVKYSAPDLLITTSIMINDIDTFNKYSTFVRDQFYLTGINTAKRLELVHSALDQAEFRIRTIQNILEPYIDKSFKEKIKEKELRN